MTGDNPSDHAPLPPTTSHPSSDMMQLPRFFPDEATRSRVLKSYCVPVASAASTICATLAVTPLENVKTRMQTHNFPSIFHCVRYLWRTEGPRGYVAGSLPPLASVTVVRVINFSTYNTSKYAIASAISNITGSSPLEHYTQSDNLPTVSSILTFTGAGMIAGLVSAPLACPFELAKNVVQTSVLVANRSCAASDAAHDPSLRYKPRLGTIDAIRQIINRHGIQGLYIGFQLHMIRDTIGTGLYFGIYETVKQIAASQIGRDKPFGGGPMIAGAICSTVPWLCTYPLDTRKTRAQSVLLGESKEIGEASLAVAKLSMYRGLSIILLRTAVNNVILLSLYEYITATIRDLD